MPTIEIRPQPGPQETFLSTPADIAFYGGAAGGGKTYALLLEGLRHINNGSFGATIFRRNSNQITNEGGLWDNAKDMYIPVGGRPVQSPRPTVYFPSGSKITFAHLQYERDKYAYQGAQIPLICCELNTPVLMADGTYKKIADLCIGDKVMTLQGTQTVIAIGNDELRECVEVEINGIKQIQTTDHDFLTTAGWISYEKMAPIAYRNNSRFSVHRRNLFQENRDRYLHGFCRGLKHIQEFFAKHEDLRQLVPEQSSCHILNAVRQLLSFVPNEYHYGHKYALWYLQKYLLLQQLRAFHIADQEHTLRRFQLSLGHQFDEVNGVHKELLRQENIGAMFLPPRQSTGLFSLYHVLQAFFQQFRDENLRVPSIAALCDVMLNVRTSRLSANSQSGCLSCNHFYDEYTHFSLKIDRYGVLQLDGVVLHNPKNLLLDEPDKARINNGYKVRYFHPYTGKEVLSEKYCQFGSCKITPIGKRLVRNITISSTNHYITESGLVNKNCYDELTHFTEGQFWYMLSRNRSMCGVRPYIRGTTNPDAESWVAKFIQWYWDPDTGYAIPERSGVIRYFARVNGELIWGNSIEEVCATSPEIIPEQVKSFTFIASKLTDNKILMEKDPGYLGNLRAQSEVERERLEKGNWLIRPAAGLYFKRSQVEMITAVPHDVIAWARAWDLAATVPTIENPDPDSTAGVLIGRRANGMYVVADVKNVQSSANEVRALIRNTAIIDQHRHGSVTVSIPQDPGQAGKEQAQSYVRLLSGFFVETIKPTGSKITRAEPFSSQWQAGNVQVLAGDWNEKYFTQLEGFPEMSHDDMVDASADAFNNLQNISDWSALIQ